MAKTAITLVDIRDDNSVIVYYSTGTTRPYKSVDKLPKTALAWLEEHKNPEPVKFLATDDGVIMTQASADPEELPEVTQAKEETTKEVKDIENHEEAAAAVPDHREAEAELQRPVIHTAAELITAPMARRKPETKEIVNDLPNARALAVWISPEAALQLTGLYLAGVMVRLALWAVRFLAIMAGAVQITAEAARRGTEAGRILWRTFYPPAARAALETADTARKWAAEAWRFRNELLITNVMGEEVAAYE